MRKNDSSRIRLTPDDQEELATLAGAVLEENDCVQGEIDPVRIIGAKGITLVFGDYRDAFDGLIRYRDGQFSIFCNRERVGGQRTTRARFTLAHELGHYFISSHRNALQAGRVPHHRSFCEYESEDFVEQQADCFASNLLLPRSRFSAEAKQYGSFGGLKTILGLSKMFNVSVTATAIRYVSLSVSPCVVIKWDGEKYGWKWLSKHAYDAGYRKTIEDKALVIPGSATAEALAGNPQPADGFFKRVTTASYWFPFVAPGTSKDLILHEHAYSLGQYGVLTMLIPESGRF